jgi:hypothetical protein
VPRKRKTLPLMSYVGGRLKLSVGAVLSVRATKGGRSAEGRSWKIRKDRKPLASAFCVHAGKREPGRC